MTTNQFNPPASASGGVKMSDLNGRLLLFKVHAVEREIRTDYGEADAVRVDITVLDGPDAPLEHDDTLVFPKVLQSQLRSNVGTMVLGRLGQGTAKPGQSPPWMLTAATPAEEQTARDHLAKKTQPAFASPAQGSPPF